MVGQVRGQPGLYRQMGPTKRGGGYNVVRGGHSQTAAQLASQTGLVISSVSSLSTPSNTFNLPKVRAVIAAYLYVTLHSPGYFYQQGGQ